ncbi:hypothetical protein [Aquimarina latercula]|uniref:hypothetical protein n=1 Tax=Aquimarina latercula TaxID=987 RepID=UPI000481E04C|nr:hypothetical protein [Aquimarina latercula]
MKTIDLTKLLGLLFLLFMFNSCDKDNLTDTAIGYEKSELYHYKGITLTEKQMNERHPNVLENSYLIINNDEIIHVFDSENEALEYDGILEDKASSNCKNDFNPYTWGFKIRFYENENFRGRWFQVRKHGISKSKGKYSANVPRSFNDKISSIVIDEIDKATGNTGGPLWTFVNCSEDYNLGGRSTNAVVNPFGCRRTWKNLRKGNWNDKISSWYVDGGGR